MHTCRHPHKVILFGHLSKLQVDQKPLSSDFSWAFGVCWGCNGSFDKQSPGLMCHSCHSPRMSNQCPYLLEFQGALQVVWFQALAMDYLVHQGRSLQIESRFLVGLCFFFTTDGWLGQCLSVKASSRFSWSFRFRNRFPGKVFFARPPVCSWLSGFPTVLTMCLSSLFRFLVLHFENIAFPFWYDVNLIPFLAYTPLPKLSCQLF